MKLLQDTVRTILSGLILLFVVDRVSKWLALHLLPREGIFIFPNVTGLVLERNQGIAYSIPLPRPWLVAVTGIILVGLVFFLMRAYRRHELPVFFSLGLITIGAFSNFLDRIRYGYVVDMFVVAAWPVFNLSDLMIIGGVGWLIITLIRSPGHARRV